jgi:hypothetical protein
LILALPKASILIATFIGPTMNDTINDVLLSMIQQSLVLLSGKNPDVIPSQKVNNLNKVNTDLRPISLNPTLGTIHHL